MQSQQKSSLNRQINIDKAYLMNYYVYVRNNESEVRSQTLANIEKERIKRKITQGQLAMKIGVSHKTYYNWINEVRDIPSRKLQRLAKILDVTMEYLLESSTEIERSRENEKFG
ncbi:MULTISPECIES: helix-turn-helix transcriptional regulator [Clostridia]|uniref:helix-turn-helix domain-containing protein n=2 Tax=Ruminococcus TaxID=1263 RepID=UPI00189B16D1